MAASTCPLIRSSNSSFHHAIQAREGAFRPASPTFSSFQTHYPRQNLLHMAPPLAEPNLGISSLKAIKGNTLSLCPSLLACGSGFRVSSVGVPSSSLSSNRTCSNGQTRRFAILHCRAGSSDKGGNLESSSQVAMKEDSEILPPGWPIVGLALFGLGFLAGPLLDGIHSRVQLQLYDNGAINIFGLQTNVWVPPMLGVFYSLAGLLQLFLDKKFAPKSSIPTASLSKVALSLISLALLLEISAELYSAGVPFNIEGYILFFFAELNWVLLENTWWGFGLAAFIGVVCPLAEIPIVKLFGLWHYPQANVSLFGEGFISWVICCYFFYTPFISNLARWLSSYQKEQAKLKQ